jgi:thiamine kinase-like enzyme
MDERLDDVIRRVWPAGVARVEILGGGITNHNLKVTVDDGVYVLRIAGKDTGLLGIDRESEREATNAAWEVGVGPEVVGFVEPEGWLLTRFIEGDTPAREAMGRPEMLARVAEALRAVHGGRAIPGAFDAFRVVEAYRDTAQERGGGVPHEFGWAQEIAARIEASRGPVAPRPCHNDLLNANFIDDGQALRIVDWEYAGMGDVFFDLANFAVNHELDRPARRALLGAYLESVQEEHEGRLELMRFMSDFREAMWGVVQATVSQLDFDFDAYAAEHFERMGRTASETEFGAALSAT